MRLTRTDWIRLLMLWLGGVDMRLTLLAVPPVIPLIHHDLHLDEKAVGVLVSMPVLLLAAAAVPGSLLIARLGVRGALLVGLGLIAAFGAVRGFGPSGPVIYGATFLMGAGVAVSQPAFPSIVREWFPRRIAVATAAYSNGVLIGETVPTAFTSPAGALPLAHGDWRWALAVWSVPVILSAVVILPRVPRLAASSSRVTRWWPNWRHRETIRIGLMMGMASAVYFAANAYLPDFLDQTGRHALITPMLAVLNAAQLLTAPAVAVWERLASGRLGFVGSGALMAAAQVGIMLTPGPAIIVWGFVLGFAAALAFIVALSIPPRIAAAGDVHRMSAGIFTFQYGTAFVVPFVAGALWDATGQALVAFVPGILAAGTMIWLAMSMKAASLHAPSG